MENKNYIPTQEQNPRGLHQRYHVTKIRPDGTIANTDVDAEYFVLRLDMSGSDFKYIKACRIGITAFADAIESTIPDLANDLRKRYPLI